MNIIRNVTEGISAGGMMIFSGGRQTGKSYYYQKMLLNSVYGSVYSNDVNSLYANMFTDSIPQSKYKFSRANWYVAEYDNKHHFEVLAWCSQQFGPYPARPDAWSRWFNMYSEKIHFRDEKDYVLFMLRWS